MKFNSVIDSGSREEFSTGAVRDTQDDKPRFDLISPLFLKRLAIHLKNGAIKYSEWNWSKGINNARCFASCLRHLFAYSIGDKTEDHLSAAAFNIMVIIHNEEAVEMKILPKELLDMPPEYINNKDIK